MRNLFNFLYRFRTFGLFLFLEGICTWLVIQTNQQHHAAFLNSSNSVAASISETSENTFDYFRLKEINQELAAENATLQKMLNEIHLHSGSVIPPHTDSVPYRLLNAKVINNTFNRSMNYLTLNVGREEGVKTGMGVVSGAGVVGQVKSVSAHFTTVISLLHRNLMISSTIKRTQTKCTTQWDGESPLRAELKYIPRHIEIHIGDSIVTSGFNAVFPAGILIGTITSFDIPDENVFYNAKIDLASDFTSLNYVYLVENLFKTEKDSLESESFEFE